jgi:hypothetical protein
LLDLDEAYVSFRWLARVLPKFARYANCSRRIAAMVMTTTPATPSTNRPRADGSGVLVVGERCCLIGLRDDS